MYYGWRITFAALMMQGMAVGVGTYLYSVIVVPIGAEFEASRLTMMLGITVCTVLSGPLAPIAGALFDRYALRGLFCIGALALATAFFLLSFITAAWQFAAIYGLFIAIGISFAGPVAAATMVSRWFVRNRGRALGIAALGTSIAGLSLPLLMQWMIDDFGWRTACQLLAGLILVVLLPIILLIVRNHPRDLGLQADGDPALPEGAEPPAVAAPLTLKAILKLPAFWIMGCSIGLLFASYNAVLSNLVPYATDGGIEPSMAAGLISIVAVFGMLGKIIFGLLADRISLKLGLGTAHGLVAVALLTYATYPDYTTIAVATALLGLAAGGMIPVWGALIARAFGTESYGAAMGFMNLVIMPFMLAAAPAAGWLYDSRGDYVLAFQVFTGGLVVAIGLLFLLRFPDEQH